MRARETLGRLAACCAFLLAGGSAAADEVPPPEPSVGEAVRDYFAHHPYRLTAATGLDFSTGDFGGGPDSDIWYVPVSLRLEWHPLILKVTVPYLRIEGGAVLVGGDPQTLTGVGGVRDGLGDVVLSAAYVHAPKQRWLPVARLTGKVKLGTASAGSGLGTGEEDYAVKLELSKAFGPVMPFVSAGYRFVGDPSGVDLDDKFSASAGVSVRPSRRFGGGLLYEWRQSSVPGRADFHEISPFGTFQPTRWFAVDPYAVIGLSSPSPDWGAGIQLRFMVERR